MEQRSRPVQNHRGSGRKKSASLRTLSHEEIAQRARLIWEREGMPGGRDDEFWFRAENELRAEL